MPGRQLSRRGVLGLGLTAAVGLVAGLAGCAPASARLDRLRIAGGEPGGTYIRFARLLAEATVRAGVARSAEALETRGSVQNIELLANGDADLAMSLADSASGATGVAAIGRVYQNYLQCVVRADGDLRTADQLRGRRLSIGAVGSGTSATAGRALDALGIGGPGTELRQLGLTDAAAGLGDGAIDALLWSGGIPAPEIADLAATVPVRLIDLSEAIRPLNDRFDGVYQTTAVPAEVYGLAADVPTLGVSNLLLCRETMPADLAGRLVDVLIDDSRRLVPEPSAGVQYLTAPNLIDTSPAPLHPGAAAAYARRYG